MYEIHLSSTYYFIVMENLFYGFSNNQDLEVYDLKGSEYRRFIKEQSQQATLLDTNFRILRNSEPISLFKDDYLLLDKAIRNDCKFLSKKDRNLIDYSLFLLIDKKKKVIKTGIIDYLRQHGFKEIVEYNYKNFISGG